MQVICNRTTYCKYSKLIPNSHFVDRMIVTFFLIPVSDKARDKDDKSRIWRYKIEGSSCSNPGNCADMEPSVTDSPEIPDSGTD